MRLASSGTHQVEGGWQLGWGLRIAHFEGLALFVEFTFSGCVYLVLDLERCAPVIEAHSANAETGKTAAVRAALRHSHGLNHGRDPAAIARSLPWSPYPL